MTDAKKHSDGLYFNLPEQDYHADTAMSASGITNLCIGPGEFWNKSHMNPFHKEVETEETRFGKIAHMAFYEPDKRKFFNADIESLSGIERAGFIDQRYRALGKIKIKDSDDLEIKKLLMWLDASGATDLIKGSASEVSYFWTDKSGFRCKIRLDGLRCDSSSDLKTYYAGIGKDPETAVAYTVANFRYNVKAYWYDMGIGHMLNHIKSKSPQIFGLENDDGTLLDLVDALIAHDGDFPHWFIFAEKKGAPNVTIRRFSRTTSSGDFNEYWKNAKELVHDATSTYAMCMADFGPDIPWIGEAKKTCFTDEEFGATPSLTR